MSPLMSNGREWMWNEEFMTLFKALSRHFSEGLSKSTKTIIQNTNVLTEIWTRPDRKRVY
jgi:hypothetical protein